MLKWALRITAVLIVLAVVGVYLFIRSLGTSGSGTVEKWIASELQTIANAHLNPRLSFEDLDYEYPGTVHLKRLTLIADDKSRPGQTITVLGTEVATIVLGEIPSIGKPVIIEKITLDRPVVRLVSDREGSSDFIGLTDMVKTTDASAKASGQTDAKLSDVFRMRLVELKDGTVEYDPRIPNTQVMTLDDIDTRLDVQPAAGGWYKVATKLAREQLFELTIGGELSLDTFDVRGLDLHIKAQIDREHDRFLPPQLQQVLVEHEVKGALELTLWGDVLVDNPMRSKLTALVRLLDANVAIDEYQIPIKDLSLNTHVADGRANITDLQIQALDGEIHVIGDLPLEGEPILNSHLRVYDVVLEDTLRKGAEGTTPKYYGRLNADITLEDAPLMAILHRVAPPETPTTGPTGEPIVVAGPSPAQGEAAAEVEEKLKVELTDYALRDLPDHWGDGEIVVDNARLVVIPFIRELTKAIGSLKGSKGPPSERVELVFDFAGEKVDLTKFDYRGDAPAHGRGTVSLDGRLDLTIDAGGIFGKVGDALLAYRVTGPADDPKFHIRGGSDELTAGTEKVGSAIGTGAKAAGSGVGKGAGWLGRQMQKIGGGKK